VKERRCDHIYWLHGKGCSRPAKYMLIFTSVDGCALNGDDTYKERAVFYCFKHARTRHARAYRKKGGGWEFAENVGGSFKRRYSDEEVRALRAE
jgi:hypothetical protein